MLDQIMPLTTRLTVRVRANDKPDALRLVTPVLIEPIHFLMERGMLHGIKRRAERSSTEELDTRTRLPDVTAAA